MLIGYCFFTSMISATQSDISNFFAYFNIFVIASFASATIGMSTSIFLEIDAASISICMIFAFFANVSIVPVIRSLNLVPIENKTSHSMIALLDARFPCIPILPTYKGWSVGIAPLPMIVVTTGIPVNSHNSCISFLACAIFTPPPIRNTGFFAWFNSARAFLS